MDNILKLLLLAAAIGGVVAVIVFFGSVLTQSKESSGAALSDLTDVSDVGGDALTVYDGTTVSGTSVIDNVNKYAYKSMLVVLDKTTAATAGSTKLDTAHYDGSDVKYTKSTTDDTTLSVASGTGTYVYDPSTTSIDTSSINKRGKFKCKVIYDDTTGGIYCYLFYQVN